MQHRTTQMLGCAALIAALPLLCAGQPHYELSYIPAPPMEGPDTVHAVVWAIPGRAVGTVGDRIFRFGKSRCWSYSDGRFTYLNTPGHRCYAWDANTKGDILVALVPEENDFVEIKPGVFTGPLPPTLIHLYRDGSLIPLGTYPGGATDLNERGDVVGNSSRDAPFTGLSNGWIYADGVMAPVLGKDLVALNEHRDLLANIPRPDFPTPQGGALAQQPAIVTRDGRTIPLGSLGGYYAGGRDINNYGEAVGYSLLTADFTKGGAAFYWDGTTLNQIQLPGTGTGSAGSINDAGEIVGSYTPGYGYYAPDFPPVPLQSRAFYSYRGRPGIDLESRILNFPAELQSPVNAHKIYNDGRILASANLRTAEGEPVQPRYFLLTPVDDKSILELDRGARRRSLVP